MNDARRCQRLLRRFRRIVSPNFRAKERRVAELARTVDLAHEAWVKRCAELLRKVEEDGVPYAAVKDEIWETWPNRP